MVLNNRDTSLRWIPKCLVHFQEAIWWACLLPDGDPIFEDASGLAIGQGHFLDTVYFQSWAVEHFLDCSRCWVVNRQGDHLVNTHGLLQSLSFEWKLIKGGEAGRLRKGGFGGRGDFDGINRVFWKVVFFLLLLLFMGVISNVFVIGAFVTFFILKWKRSKWEMTRLTSSTGLSSFCIYLYSSVATALSIRSIIKFSCCCRYFSSS